MKCSRTITRLALIILIIVVLENGHQAYGGHIEPYKVLGVHRRASLADIRKAYKQLAKEWHPDKVSGGQEKKEEAEAKFIEINRAYELLRYAFIDPFVGIISVGGGGTYFFYLFTMEREEI